MVNEDNENMYHWHFQILGNPSDYLLRNHSLSRMAGPAWVAAFVDLSVATTANAAETGIG